jgi:hypothetical protein
MAVVLSTADVVNVVLAVNTVPARLRAVPASHVAHPARVPSGSLPQRTGSRTTAEFDGRDEQSPLADDRLGRRPDSFVDRVDVAAATTAAAPAAMRVTASTINSDSIRIRTDQGKRNTCIIPS